MNFKLVICDVRDGPRTVRSTPNIPGVKWDEVLGTRREIGSYYQAFFSGMVPEDALDDLPDHCYLMDDIHR